MSSSEGEYSDIDVVLYQLRPSDATKNHNNIQEPTPYKIKYNYQQRDASIHEAQLISTVSLPISETQQYPCRRNAKKIQQKLLTFFQRYDTNPNKLETLLFKKYKYQKVNPILIDGPQHFSDRPPQMHYEFEDMNKELQTKTKMKKIRKQISTQQEYLQTVFQSELYEEPIEQGDLKKSWAIIVRNVQKVGRFKQRYRADFKEFIKRLVYAVAREVRKKHLKCQKYQKDFILRAKKLSKDTQSYWRKRDKELIEIKKRKEKLEQERKKKEEEEKEQMLQQRRLDFLMKQSDIYAHFMAKKLGIELDVKHSNGVDEFEALENVQKIINENRKQLTQFDGQQKESVKLTELKLDQADQDQMSNLLHPPISFRGELKEYQLKGLRWLDNLYEQGINGILADEMGLGKTIQAIALLSHISSAKNVWGPFLVIAPSSTLHNWQQEIRKFCPGLKVLPYWGQASQRKLIRKYFQQRNFGRKESVFHIVVTSYNLVVSDNKIFHRLRWQYMILDEAQAIKNINSQRWSILLSFNARNRLLLTGTPIQNTMGELWALLHFIMPKFFDSFEQFQEWFSKDIEAHSQDQRTLNQHQLQRLHSILKPFMLRRLKKDVENEIGQKREVQITCEMTSRQALLYKNIKSKLSIKEFFRMLDSKQKVDNLMNLVMQFRKICNHPELFERKPYKTPYVFQNKYCLEGASTQSFVSVRLRNPIKFVIPKIIYDQLLTRYQRLLVFTSHYIYQSLREGSSTFAFIDLKHMSLNQFQKYDVDIDNQHQQVQELLQYYDAPKYKFYLREKQFPKIDKSFPKFIANLPMTLAQPIDFECHSKGFYNDFHSILYNRRILRHFANENLSSFIIPNSPESLISQSSKLLQLDRLLKDLKKKQWRVLIFCQMTKMLDILEEYMIHRGYTYFRMDGQCQINDRRDMVNEFQQNDKIFAFLLSTRAGGLGITLTQADAVIFYDNDWNPTMDAQATDRAHRIGRTKDVYVYRLVTKGTIEERIVKRAQQKQNVQSTVYSGGFQGDKFKPQEVFELLFDEQEMDDTVTNKFIQKGQKKKKKAPKQQDQNQEEEDIIEVDLNILEQNEKDIEDAD